MKKGDIVRLKNHMASLCLWRVDETFEGRSPFVVGILVTETKRTPAGSEKRLLAKEDYVIESDPEGWSVRHQLGLDLKAMHKEKT